MRINIGSPVRIIVFLIAILCGAQMNAFAQNVTSATLSGVVEDENGAIVLGATLTATNVETNQQRTTDSGLDGHFRFLYLPVGNYKLTVAVSGFRTLSRDITLTVGQSLYFLFKLDVNNLAVNVTVTEVSPIETTRTQVTQTIRPAEIAQLPLNGRNYLDLALLVPGVSPTNT